MLPVTRHPDSRFIALEGIDGAGTTTHTRRLMKALRELGKDARATCEPSSGPIGGTIRQILQNRLVVADPSGARPFKWSTMALLFAADRLDHLDSEVLPALREGATVITDRYDLSSLAYQSATAPQGEEVLPWIRALNRNAIRPDLTIVLQVPLAVAEQRRQARGAEELFERPELQEKLAALYAQARDLLPEDRICFVSAEGAVEEVGQRILDAARSVYDD